MPLNELDIREELMNLIENVDPDNEAFGQSHAEALMRNSFCIRLEDDGPIFTVTITHGGALSA